MRRRDAADRKCSDFLIAYSALFDHGLASKFDQRFASIRSTGNLTFSTAFYRFFPCFPLSGDF
ncbi:hypothetical protein FZN28_27685, partial [Escherichia coli]|nr:hypothetical protein [Escherichia coli]